MIAIGDVTSVLVSIVTFLGARFKEWVLIFIAPVYPKIEPDILWIIIPIWINFLIAELYLEKHGTTIGNAIQNGLVAALVGVDWIRYLMRSGAPMDQILGIKYAISVVVLVYGCIVIYVGIKGKSLTRRLGKIRAVTYALAVFTPMIYGLVQVTKSSILAAIIFFPVYYALVEMIDRRIPTQVYA